MSRLLKFKTTDHDIGIATRAQTEGPESVLLNEFVEQYTNQLSSLKRHYALFFEPLVPTGYPDLVVVTYNPRIYESWTEERAALGVSDLKVLHHLYFVNGATSSAMEKQLGFDSKKLLRILERLMDASLLRRAKHRWIPRQLRNTYGINNIRTIEAKISDWPCALRQANINRWFASESFVLSPVSNPSARVRTKAQEKGIGIYSMASGMRAKTIQKPIRSSGLPISYASWLFNGWIGRQLMRERGSI